MPDYRRLPRFGYRLISLPPRIVYALGLGALIGRMVLLLTTTGRKSGLPHTTPLQYMQEGDIIYVASARGQDADWFRNIAAAPDVTVRVKGICFSTQAESIIDPGRIADFLELRLRRNPRIVGLMLRTDGIPSQPSREELEAYAVRLAMVVLTVPPTPALR